VIDKVLCGRHRASQVIGHNRSDRRIANGPVNGNDRYGHSLEQIAERVILRVGRYDYQAVYTVADQNIEVIEIVARLIACDCDNEKGIVGARDGLHRFSATGKERIGNAWNDQPDRFGSMPLEGSCGLVWHIAKRLDYAPNVRKGFRTYPIAAVNYAGDCRGTDARFSSNLAEGWVCITLRHLRAAKLEAVAVTQVYSAFS
jgi:hypothetical protein